MNEEQKEYSAAPMVIENYGNKETQNTLPLIIEKESSVKLFQGASTLKLSDLENAILEKPFDPKDIQIRPDGIVYLEQVFFRDRLNQAFGRGQWAIIPVKDGTDESGMLYYLGELYVRGNFVARACGSHRKQESNQIQSWADCYESAKSDCITRCCKDLGIAKELWSREYDQKWIAKNAVKIYNSKRGKWLWRKNTDEPFWWEEKQLKSSGKQEPMENQDDVIKDQSNLQKELAIKISVAIVNLGSYEAPINATNDEKKLLYGELLYKFSEYKDFPRARTVTDLYKFSIERLRTIYGKVKKELADAEKASKVNKGELL